MTGLGQVNMLLHLFYQGDPTSTINVALQLPHSSLRFSHLDFSSLEEKVLSDPFFQNTQVYLPPLPSISAYYFSDYLQIVSPATLVLLQSQPYLQQSFSDPARNINQLISIYVLTTLQGKDRTAQADYKIGQHYFYGWGVSRDYSQAKSHFEQALPGSPRESSLKGRDHVMTAFYLGHMHQQGLGLNQNLTQMAAYFHRVEILTKKSFLIPFPLLRLASRLYHDPTLLWSGLSSWYETSELSLTSQKAVLMLLLTYLMTCNMALKLRYEAILKRHE